MNRTVVERIALAAGLVVRRKGILTASQSEPVSWRGTDEAVALFAALVAEECAATVEAERLEGPATRPDDVGYQSAIEDAAAAIRARFSVPRRGD